MTFTQIAINSQTTKLYHSFPVIDGVATAHKKERSFIKVEFFSNSGGVGSQGVTINGNSYVPYTFGSSLIVELTSLVATYAGTSSIDVYDGFGINIIGTIDFNAVEGFRQSNIVTDCYPSEILVLEGDDKPFYLQTFNTATWLNYGVEEVIGADGVVGTFDILGYINNSNFARHLTTIGTTFDDTFDQTFNDDGVEERDIILTPIRCPDIYVLIEWVSKFGQRKSWWFEVLTTTTESSKRVALDTLGDGLTAYNDIEQKMLVVSKNADQFNQTYLSDLVVSDTIYLYNGIGISKQKVIVETKAFTIDRHRKDVSFILNTMRYDNN